MKVLAISSSRVGTGGYLENASSMISNFLGEKSLEVAFIPFASVQNDCEAYAQTVREALPSEYNITALTPENAREVLENTDAIMVGGGNTFKLLHDIYELKIFDLIVEKVKTGTPYVGWSAGANITGRTIGTTNDMPVIQPASLDAFAFFPFQINPHYTNLVVPGYNGETRDQRLEEFLVVNPTSTIVALPEGTALHLNANELQFVGEQQGTLFCRNENGQLQKQPIALRQSLAYLL